MVGKDAGFVKTTRIKEIKREMAQTISKGIAKDRLLDWIEINVGLTRLTATSYVDLVIRSSGWVEIDGKILCDLPSV